MNQNEFEQEITTFPHKDTIEGFLKSQLNVDGVMETIFHKFPFGHEKILSFGLPMIADVEFTISEALDVRFTQKLDDSLEIMQNRYYTCEIIENALKRCIREKN